MMHRSFRGTVAFAAILCALSDPVHGVVYGVKSTPGAPTQAPAYLFACREDGMAATMIGLIRIDGALADIDALALSRDDVLFGFEQTPTGDALVQLDRDTGAGARIGPVLSGRDIRAAAFDMADDLLVLDRTASELLRIDVATGLPVGAPVPLRLGGGLISLDGACDVAFDGNGDGWVGSGSTLLRLEVATGAMSLHSVQPAWNLGGLCVSIHALDAECLFIADAAARTDVGCLTLDDDGVTTLYPDVMPGVSTGALDLAGRVTPPPSPCPGDVDGDMRVTFADLNRVLDFWGRPAGPGDTEDVTGDGLVNFADLNLVLDRWGDDCDP